MVGEVSCNVSDLLRLKKHIKLPINLEMAATDEMLKIAIKTKPNAVCIVPEKRQEVTTEGGLDLIKNHELNNKGKLNLVSSERRLNNHKRNKEWDYVICFTSAKDNINKAHAKFLESISIEKAEEVLDEKAS